MIQGVHLSNDIAELDSLEEFMDWVEERHPGEAEYHQAVRGVAENVIDLARDNEDFRKQRVLQRLTEPDRIISFRVTWETDDEDFRVSRGYRVQHSNAIGPYKGGLRFEPAVNQSVLKFLAFEQSLKNSLTGLNLGAGKGGADFDPACCSDSEIRRFCQSFMTELHRHIGPMTDVPAGDIGVGSREIGYLFGQYKRLENEYSGALTGKAIGAGGSQMREEATGYGVVYFLCFMLDDEDRELEGQRIAVSGAGNVAIHVAEKATALGGKVLTLSNRQGTLYKGAGLDDADVTRIKREYGNGSGLESLADAVGAEFRDGEKPWSVDCDIAIPSATQNELDEDDAGNLVDNKCRIVAEAANMPLTAAAAVKLCESDVVILPGKAANAGGVAVSGFEMSQNRMGQPWSVNRLDRELRDVMGSIYEQARTNGEVDGRIDYRRGADRAGFCRLATAIASFGPV